MSAKDALGEALKDFHFTSTKEEITVLSDISENDIIPIKYLFRTIDQMPKIEQRALALCLGNILDVGAASGCHSLVLQQKNKAVKSVDISEGAVAVMKDRGVSNVELIDFFDVKDVKYDTLLLLMNGIGIAGTITKLPKFLEQCKVLLNPGGQVLLDSSDIAYMFEEEDGSKWVDVNKAYHGEVIYQMKYQNTITDQFDWLFVDYDTLKLYAEKAGFKIEKVMDGEHYDYLARLTL